MSSGVHYSHSPYYIRRVRIIATDSLCRVCEELGYPVLPEVGQDPKNPTTKVLEFSVKAPAGRVKGDAAAIEQLENYKKMLMEHYVDHNCSITVHVRENEWEDEEQWDDNVILEPFKGVFAAVNRAKRNRDADLDKLIKKAERHIRSFFECGVSAFDNSESIETYSTFFKDDSSSKDFLVEVRGVEPR